MNTSRPYKRGITYDHATQAPIPPSLNGFFDSLLDSGKDLLTTTGGLLKDAAGTYISATIQTKQQTDLLKKQTQSDLAKQKLEAELALAKARQDATMQQQQREITASGGSAWYSDPKIMLPLAGGLGLLWYFTRRKQRG